VLRGITLTVRFLCELAMLAGLANWGTHVADGVAAWLLGIGAPVMAAVVWGAFVAPKAKWPAPVPFRLAIELALFGTGAFGFAVAGQPVIAVALAVAGLVTSLINALQESAIRPAGPPDPFGV